MKPDKGFVQINNGVSKRIVKRSTSGRTFETCPSGFELHKFCVSEFTPREHYLNINCGAENYGYFTRSTNTSCCRFELANLKANCDLIMADHTEMVNWLSSDNHNSWYSRNANCEWDNIEKLSEFLNPFRSTININVFGVALEDYVYNATLNEYRVFRKDGKVMCIINKGHGSAILKRCPPHVERIRINLNNPIFRRSLLSQEIPSIITPTWNEFTYFLKENRNDILLEGGKNDFSDY